MPHSPFTPKPTTLTTLTAEQQQCLLRLARLTIASHWQPDIQAEQKELASLLQPLDTPCACFVTLHDAQGELRGCIGTLQAERPLLAAVVFYASAAAFSDPRFPPLSAKELPLITVSITLLGPLTPLVASTRQELASALRPHQDGLVLQAGPHSATFLPAVWRQLPTPEQFISALLRKGGWPHEGWPQGIQAWRYAGIEFTESTTSR